MIKFIASFLRIFVSVSGFFLGLKLKLDGENQVQVKYEASLYQIKKQTRYESVC